MPLTSKTDVEQRAEIYSVLAIIIVVMGGGFFAFFVTILGVIASIGLLKLVVEFGAVIFL